MTVKPHRAHTAAVIVPAWRSDRTLAESLDGLACQDYPSLEIVLVESEPGGAAEALVRNNFPSVRYISFPGRLLPHAARNLGVQNCDAEYLLFTDPDITMPPSWVSQMVKAHEQYDGVIAGSLDNASSRWLDWGMHLSKFDLFLPMGKPARWETCATGNMLCTRSDFERAGGFVQGEMLGDLLISWSFERQHIPVTFVPAIVGRHHHLGGLGAFLRERFVRGRDFGRLRQEYFHWSREQTLRQAAWTLSGLRLLNLVRRTGVRARRAGRFGWYVASLPVILLGHAAWLAGELQAYTP